MFGLENVKEYLDVCVGGGAQETSLEVETCTNKEIISKMNCTIRFNNKTAPAVLSRQV
jgi:hypothetical protein